MQLLLATAVTEIILQVVCAEIDGYFFVLYIDFIDRFSYENEFKLSDRRNAICIVLFDCFKVYGTAEQL